MTDLAFTSIPPWARSDATAPADPAGTSSVLVAVGPAAGEVLARWVSELADRPSVVIETPTGDERAAGRLADALASARVGVRVRLAGPVGDCLRLRAVATAAGLEDDELTVHPTGRGAIDVFCTHCRTITTGEADVEATLPCAGCGRSLLVYHHVSRRSGTWMGYQVDAEEGPA